MSIVGYIVSIPVFCDSAFIILAPLVKALTKQAKISLAIGAMALSMGLYVTHSLIPPTPGPVAAAGLLDADLGMVILMGLPVSLVALMAGYLFSIKIAANTHIQPPAEDTIQNLSEQSSAGPSTVKSLMPIFLPIILIVIRSINELQSQRIKYGTLFRRHHANACQTDVVS